MKVLISLPEKDNEYQVLQTADAVESARKLGLSLEFTYAENTPVLQLQQLMRSVRADPAPRALVIEPVSAEGIERLIGKAAGSGLGVAVLNCSTPVLDRMRAEFTGTPVFTVESDQREIGRLQGRQVRTLVPPNSTVLYIHGPQIATPAQDRYQGFREALAGYPLQVIVLDGQWTEVSAERAVRNWLRLKTSEGVRVDLVAAQDDSMARGARNAVADAPEGATCWSRIPYLGIDGVPEVGQQLVREGVLTGTVVMPSNTGAALQHIARWLKHGIAPPPAVKLPVASYPPEAALRLAQRPA